jgi:ornithine carrier protein
MELAKRPIAVVEGAPRVSEPARVEEVRSTSTGQGQEALQDVVCGSLAGVVGKYIEYPFDTVKVRLQSQPDHLPLQYNGPLDCFKKSLNRDGFFGIYRGISAPLVGAAVETSCLFFSVSLVGPGRQDLENSAYGYNSTV